MNLEACASDVVRGKKRRGGPQDCEKASLSHDP